LEEENLQVTPPNQSSSAAEADVKMADAPGPSTSVFSDDDLGLEEDSSVQSAIAVPSTNLFTDDLGLEEDSVQSTMAVPSTNLFTDDLGLEEDDSIRAVSASQATGTNSGASKNRFSTKEKDSLFSDSNHEIDEYGSQEQSVTKVFTETLKQSTATPHAATSNSSTISHLSDVGNNLALLEQRMIDSLVFLLLLLLLSLLLLLLLLFDIFLCFS
jgi:hypothetical protein